MAKHSYTYNPLGNIQTWKREVDLANPTGGTSQYQSTIYYDQADQLSSLTNAPLSGSTVANTGYHYLYDLAGNIASKQVETSGTGATMTTYSHNNLNQLTGIGGTAGVRQVIVRGETNEPATVKVKPSIASVWKDARMLGGNRFESDQEFATGANTLYIQAKDGSNNVSDYTYSLNLAAATAATPTYDTDGNLLSDGVRSYAWDSQSRLMKITWGGSPVKSTEYRYNALGQRSEQIEKSGTTETARYYYLYEGIQLLCRYTGGTAVVNIDRRYLSQGEQRKNGSVWASHYYNRDHLGSIREVMNADGTLAARYDYDPYGRRQIRYQASAYAGGCDRGYTGHITQRSAVPFQGEIVLTLFRAYDPGLGKWLSVDPIGEEGGLNLYGYVRGNSLNLRDPYGLDPDLNLNPHGLSEGGGCENAAAYKKYAQDIDNSDPKVFQVYGHGVSSYIIDMRAVSSADRPKLRAKELIEAMKKENPKKWEEATEIKLHSCRTGKGQNSVAQLVADLSGKTVVAPTELLWLSGDIADAKENVFPPIQDKNAKGEWKPFSPRPPDQQPDWNK